MSDIINAFLQIVILSSVMIAIVILVKSLFAKRVSPSIMAVLWIMILLRLTLPITIESPIQITSTILPTKSILTDNVISNNQDVTTNINDKPNLDNNTIDTYNEEPIKYTNNIPSTAKNNDTQISKQDNVINKLKGISLYELIFILWCIGAIFMLIKAFLVTLGFYSKLRKCRNVENPLVLNLVTRQKNELAIKKTIGIVECDHVDVPMVFGYFKPNLLIPKKYLTKNEDNLYYILLHEMCHIARHDILKNYLWLFAKVIHWFNPLVYVAYKMYQDNIELCCDQMVVNRLSKDDKYRYSQTLVDVIRMSSRKNPLPAAASLCTSKSVLKERVLMMIQPRKKSRTALIISLVLSIIMVFAGFTTACMPKAFAEKNKIPNISIAEMVEGADYRTTHFYENAPETWEETITNKETGTNVYIDTQVHVESEIWSIHEIFPEEINQEKIDAMLEDLVGDRPIYLDLKKSKNELSKEIETIKKVIDKLKDDSIAKIYDEQLKIRESILKEGNLDTIPINTDIDKLGYLELDAINNYIDAGAPLSEIHSLMFNNIGLVDMGNERLATVQLDAKTGRIVFDNIGMDSVSFRRNDITLDDIHASPKLSATMRKLDDVERKILDGNGINPGINGRVYYLNKSDNDSEHPTYSFNYGIVHNNKYLWPDSINLHQFLDINRKNSIPMIHLAFIADTEQIRYVEIFSPTLKTKLLMRGAKLLEFEDVIDILKNSLKNNKSLDTINADDKDIHINHMMLTYTHIKDIDGRLLKVPVWEIYGKAVSAFDMDEYDATSESDSLYGESQMHIMTINAIDGTIINR